MSGKDKDKLMHLPSKKELVAVIISQTFCLKSLNSIFTFKKSYYIFLFLVGNYVVLCDTQCGF